MINKKISNFITIEGIDGAGKSTVINFIKDYFEKNGLSCFLTKEPYGEQRNEILNQKKITINEIAELFASNRIKHINDVILPNLAQRKIVICDRFLDSSIAYQVYGQGLDYQLVCNLNKQAFNYLPCLTIYLDVDVLVAQKRIMKNRQNNELNAFDQKSLDFYENVKNGYMFLLKNNSDRIFCIDANQNIDNVQKQVLKVLQENFKYEN